MYHPGTYWESDRSKCTYYSGISILNVPRKLDGTVLFSKSSERNKENVTNEERSFRSGGGCVHQTFQLEQMVEKYSKKTKEIYLIFMDLEMV